MKISQLTGNILALIGIGLAFYILLREMAEPGQSRRLAGKVEAIVKGAGVEVDLSRITPYDTTYSVDLVGKVRSQEDAQRLKKALENGLTADELDHLIIQLEPRDGRTSEGRKAEAR